MSGLLALAVSDSLGVPAEFRSREYLRVHPVATMTGFGTHHQPPGTWSDDTSMIFCTAESMLSGFDLDDMGRRFVRWLDEGYWTAHGDAFDAGGTTRNAIDRLRRGTPVSESGDFDEWSNGNGSLMRILPVALYFAGSQEAEMLDVLHRTSAITHAHPRSMIACGLYGLLVRGLLAGAAPSEAYSQACALGKVMYAPGGAGLEFICSLVQRRASDSTRQPMPPNPGAVSRELRHFDRFLSGRLAEVDELDIESGGYVVHTLEASVWSLLNTTDFASAVLKAVNLGGDTDTTGAVTGGLAGICYGEESIPAEWLAALARREDIEDLARRFSEAVARRRLG